MTWTKLGTEFWDDCAHAALSDAAVRTHGEAVGWIYRVESLDLGIPKQLVRRFAGSPCYESAVADLVAAGFWIASADRYVVVHHADVIRASIVAQQKQRERSKSAQAAWRERQKKSGRDLEEVSDDVSDDVSDNAVSQSKQTDSQEVEATTDRTQQSAARDGWCPGCKYFSRRLIDGRCPSCRAEAS